MGSHGGRPARSLGAILLMIAPVLVLVTGLAATGTVVQALRGAERARAEEQLDREVASLTGGITAEMDRYRDLSVAARGLFEGSSEVSRAELGRFADSLDLAGRYPGAASISVLTTADGDGLARIQATRTPSEVLQEPALPELGDGQHLVVTAARRADRSAPLIGADLSRTGELASALRSARDTGLPTLSEAYVLLPDRELPPDQQQLSFVVAVPVYDRGSTPDGRLQRRAALRGWVQVPIRGGDFLSRTLAGRDENLEIRLLDGRANPLPGQALPRLVATLAGSGDPELDAGRSVLLARQVALDVVGREWTLEVVPHGGYFVPGRSAASSVAGLSGVMVSVLLATLVAAQALARRRALQQVADATEQLREANTQLAVRGDEFAYAALHDPLTGLPNRTLLVDRLSHALDRHRRRPSSTAVMFCDLDGFKVINDTRGHDVGDVVLIEVARRLLTCVRPSDTVARLGGDEFVVMCEDIAVTDSAHVITRIREAIVAPIPHPAGALRVDVSIGTAYLDDHHADAADILRDADTAMYGVKTARQGVH